MGELEAAVEAFQAREVAGESALAQQLGEATAEVKQLREQLAATAADKESLGEQLAEAQGERQRLDAKVAKHKQVGAGSGSRGCWACCGLKSRRCCSQLPMLPHSIPTTAALPSPTKQEVEEVEERLHARTAELDASKAAADAAGEQLAEAEARGRDLYEENKRLSEHISVRAWV